MNASWQYLVSPNKGGEKRGKKVGTGSGVLEGTYLLYSYIEDCPTSEGGWPSSCFMSTLCPPGHFGVRFRPRQGVLSDPPS